MLRWGCLPIWTLIVASAAWGDVHVGTIEGVPNYPWYYGCGPTAGGMIVGYWDARGFGNLIAGSNDWATNTRAIEDMIASPGNIRDYYDVYPGDRLATPQDPLHADDCLADFMGCSRGSCQSGVSLDTKQAAGLIGYFKLRGYPNATGACVGFGVAWNVLVANIDAGRPMELLVDHDGDGTADHFVTAIGYSFQGDPSSPTSREYYCLDQQSAQPQWYPYVAVGGGAHWAVSSGIWFNPGSGALPGDANEDGTVNALDYLALKQNMGIDGQATWADGDFDRNGRVDDLDLLALEANFGMTWNAPLAASLDAPAVPEPAAASLLGLGAAMQLLAGRRGAAAAPRPKGHAKTGAGPA